MGNYRARRPGFLEAWKIDAAHLMFEGKTDREITDIMWKKEVSIADEHKRKNAYKNARSRLQRLRKDPKFQEYYQTIVTEWRVHATGPALMKLRQQIESTDGWLANKASNDVLNRTGMDPFADNAADNTVTFKFEGMPELGEPPTDEGDAD